MTLKIKMKIENVSNYFFQQYLLLEESKNKSHGYVEKSLLILSFHHDSKNQSEV
jgi:hypothetical protein